MPGPSVNLKNDGTVEVTLLGNVLEENVDYVISEKEKTSIFEVQFGEGNSVFFYLN